MNFSKIPLKHHLNSDEHDLLADFYRPVLTTARKYDRAVGYFSSSAFKACASELASFVGKEGQIRLVVGCLVSQCDIDALQGIKVHDAETRILREKLHRDLLQLSKNDQAATGLLSKLILSGVATLKFAVRREGIYHEKFGLFEDYDGGKIAFIGSANETEAALTLGGNHESISIYCSSEHSIYAAYGASLEKRFEDLWCGRTRNTRIYDLDDESLAFVRELSLKTDVKCNSVPAAKKDSELRDYQFKALKAWSQNKCCGILAMATGTGKTKTAIYAIQEFVSKARSGIVVITVPYQALGHQWIAELQKAGLAPIKVFESSSHWYHMVQNIFLSNVSGIHVGSKAAVMVCVNKTFEDSTFQSLLKMLASRQREKLIIVDEVHHFNSSTSIKNLPIDFKYRLGLSATPYEPDEKRYLEQYFGDIVFEFRIKQAIEQEILCPYLYRPILIELNGDEAQQFISLTAESRRQRQEGKNKITGAVKDEEIDRLLENLTAKLVKLQEHIQANGIQNFALFYCGSGSINAPDGERHRQIHLVTQLLASMRWHVGKITADESPALRRATLDAFKSQQLNAIASIRVLDEGMDIPDCRSAYILASQRSTRQAIQRRGRVLRKAPNKEHATLYDFIIVGPHLSNIDLEALYGRELYRARMFAEDASNREECLHLLNGI
jgi:superfamily II DNA or RNA helicase